MGTAEPACTTPSLGSEQPHSWHKQSRATGAEGPDMAGTGRFPAGAKGPDTGGRAQQARVPDNWQHTATPRNTPRRQPVPLPAPNIIKQDPVVFHKSSVGLNEGGQRLSTTPLTSPTEPSPGLDIFPWMENIPERLIQRLRWTQGTSPKVPSSGPIIVLLYAGKEDPTSLDSCLHANYPHLSSMVVAVDILRSGPKGNHDMLQPELYGALCTAAKQGRVVFIGGGPNCRTWSILRHIPKPGAPTPVRGRTPETLWGLPHLDQAAQTQLDDDSILILRQMYITSLARASRAAVSLPGPRSFLEHPEDPVVSSSLPKAKECSSFWITEEGQLWMEELLPIQDWDQMRCTHHSHVGTNESSTLMAKAIAVSLAALGHIRIPSQFPGNPKEPPKGRGSDPPEGPSLRGKRGPNQGGGPSSSHQGSKPGGKSAPKPRLHGQIHLEADTVSPCGTMNPDFPSPMPPMAGEGRTWGPGPGPPRMPARFQGPTPH